jgi:hypothetical protein
MRINRTKRLPTIVKKPFGSLEPDGFFFGLFFISANQLNQRSILISIHFWDSDIV